MKQSGNNLDAKGRQAANAMRICHMVATMCFIPLHQKDMNNEEYLNKHNRQFSDIICLVTDIMDSSADEALGGGTLRFTLDGCVLAPLFFVAVRCRHKILRRKAISLLRMSRRVEGLWDSLFLAQIAEKVMEIEESQCGGADAAKPLKILDFDIRFEEGRRRASVKYVIRGREDSLNPEVKEREDVVVW
jgi:hypothetical protein